MSPHFLVRLAAGRRRGCVRWPRLRKAKDGRKSSLLAPPPTTTTSFVQRAPSGHFLQEALAVKWMNTHAALIGGCWWRRTWKVRTVLLQAHAGKSTRPDNQKRVKYGLGQMFFFSLLLLQKKKKPHWRKKKEKTLVEMPSALNEQLREGHFDVTIIPKLICLQSQVLRASNSNKEKDKDSRQKKGKVSWIKSCFDPAVDRWPHLEARLGVTHHKQLPVTQRYLMLGCSFCFVSFLQLCSFPVRPTNCC